MNNSKELTNTISLTTSQLLSLLLDSNVNYLDDLNVDELRVRIASFEALDVMSLSDDELKSEFYNVLSAERNGYYHQSRSMPTLEVAKGQQFLRARILNPNKCSLVRQNFEELITICDFGPPPDGAPSQGRFNRQGEALLYTVLAEPGALGTVFEEARVSRNDIVALTLFEATQDLTLFNIAQSCYDRNSMTVENQIKVGLVEEFIGRLFFQRSDSDQERVYKVSRVVLEGCFRIVDEDMVSGWFYPSVKSPLNKNACFLPSAFNTKLKVKRAYVCRHYGHDKVNFESYCLIDNNETLKFLCNGIPSHQLLASELSNYLSKMKPIMFAPPPS